MRAPRVGACPREAREQERRVSLAVLCGDEGDDVLIGGHITDKAKGATVRAARAVTGGRWYYEVKLGDRHEGRIGFCSSDWDPDSAQDAANKKKTDIKKETNKKKHRPFRQ